MEVLLDGSPLGKFDAAVTQVSCKPSLPLSFPPCPPRPPCVHDCVRESSGANVVRVRIMGAMCVCVCVCVCVCWRVVGGRR